MARRKRGASEVKGIQTAWKCARCKRYAVPDTAFTQIDPRYTVGVCSYCGPAALVAAESSPIRPEAQHASP